MKRDRPEVLSRAGGGWSTHAVMCWLAVGIAVIGLAQAAGAGLNAWTLTGPWPSGGNVAGLAVAPSDPTLVYAAVSGALFRSTDAGATWSAVDIGAASLYAPIAAIAIDPRTPSTLYVGGGSAFGEGSFGFVMRSTDAGRTWVSTLERSL